MLVDSHCHLHMLPEYSGHPQADLEGVRAALDAGVGAMLTVAVDAASAVEVERLVGQSEAVYGAIGLHPNEAHAGLPAGYFDRLESHPRLIAIGETGLDYYRDHAPADMQKSVFRAHVGAARELRKPLIIHIRDAFDDVTQLLRQENAAEVGGIIHCYTGNWETAQPLLDLGFHFSFSGIITFKSADALREVVRQMPAERLLVETDAPFLAPVPWRGKTNQPAYVVKVAEAVAKVRQQSFDEVCRQTTANFFALFDLISQEALS